MLLSHKERFAWCCELLPFATYLIQLIRLLHVCVLHCIMYLYKKYFACLFLAETWQAVDQGEPERTE